MSVLVALWIVLFVVYLVNRHPVMMASIAWVGVLVVVIRLRS